LAETTDPHAPGWTRQVFSEPYRASRDWVRRRMADAGLEVHVDPAGNIAGRLAGHRTGAPPVVTGSHTDTVHGGGRFDGIVGVLGAIEAVRRLHETGQRLDHDLLVIDFLGEETNPFGYLPGQQGGSGRPSSRRPGPHRFGGEPAGGRTDRVRRRP
jgi:N-carbamoyl-L-amino-acid hydrolase